MEKRRLLHAPTMVFITVLLALMYIYGYIEQISDNNQSISAYDEATLGQ